MSLLEAIYLDAETLKQAKRFSHMHLKILRALHEAGEKGMALNELVNYVYRDDPEGGPINVRIVLHLAVQRINKKLGYKGPFRIVTRPRSGLKSRRYLEPLPCQKTSLSRTSEKSSSLTPDT